MSASAVAGPADVVAALAAARRLDTPAFIRLFDPDWANTGLAAAAAAAVGGSDGPPTAVAPR
ncbi:MAG: hypothetical protein WCG47_25275, partial [Dermatophilaceae bacterium]